MSLDKLREMISHSRRGDRILHPWAWLSAIVVPSLLLLVAGWLRTTGPPPDQAASDSVTRLLDTTLALASVFGTSVEILLVKGLIDRRNSHFVRVHALWKELVNALGQMALSRRFAFEAYAVDVNRLIEEAEMVETVKCTRAFLLFSVGTIGATIINILSYLPSLAGVTLSLTVPGIILTLLSVFAVLYVANFLMKDLPEHEERETEFWDRGAGPAFTGLGHPRPAFARERAYPKRSFPLYVILSFLTLGVFAVYWIYTLMKDLNHHFRDHINFENTILLQLSAGDG